jgi:hypothetical protein
MEQGPGNSNEQPKYTLEDYEQEKNRDVDVRANNIGAWQRAMHQHGQRLREMETYLKQTGVLEYSPEERLNAELDKLFPSAKSKTIVEYRGNKYRVRYFPLDKSNSGKTVYEWGHAWELVKEK